jgi:hypothetical protein
MSAVSDTRPLMQRSGTRLAIRYAIAILLTVVFVFPIYRLVKI